MQSRSIALIASKFTYSRRGAILIVGGTAIGQLFGLMAAPILSRIYSPSDFGVFTVVSSSVLVFATVSALRFELAIPLPAEEKDSHSLAALGLLCILATTSVGMAVVALFGTNIAAAFHQENLMPWLWYVPIIASTMGAFAVMNQLAIRQRRYGAIARRNVLQQLSTVVTQVAAGAASSGPGGLIFGVGLGQGSGALSLIKGSRIRSADAREGRRIKNMRRIAMRYRRFPLLLAPAGLFNVLGLQLPVILMAFWYSSEVAGWLGLTQRVLSLPMTLIGMSIAQVYIGELSRAVRGLAGEVRSLFYRTSRRLAIAGLCAGVPVILLAPWAFSIVFGAEWTQSGEYARALAINLAVQLLAVPVSQTLIVLGRQSAQLGWDVGRLVLTSSAVAICGVRGLPPLTAVWAMSLTSAIAYLVSWKLSRDAVRRQMASFGSEILNV